MQDVGALPKRPFCQATEIVDSTFAEFVSITERLSDPVFTVINRSPAEQMVCQPFLERAIALVKPKMLLLVGGASAKSLLKKEEGILSLRGRWFEWRSSAGDLELPAMPTLHPAFLLRQPAAKKRAWADLLTLTERLDRGERPG